MKKYIVVVIQGYELLSADGTMHEITTIELIESDPKKALRRAKKLVKKKEYRISNIIERYVST